MKGAVNPSFILQNPHVAMGKVCFDKPQLLSSDNLFAEKTIQVEQVP